MTTKSGVYFAFAVAAAAAAILSVAVVVVESVVEDDVRCLRGVKSSLQDRQGRLSSWKFNNDSVGFICSFVGASCWNDRENRLITLQLPQMELSGQIPDALQFCPSLQTLDLSRNSISGPIPPNLCVWMPYLVTLDLSNNDLVGPIPADLVNCKFLNNIVISNNRLSGGIPYQLSRLTRLKKFVAANNQLSGEIPSFLSSLSSSSEGDFDGNPKLCGRPLGSCGASKKKRNLIVIIAAGVFGAAVSLLLGVALWWWCFGRVSGRRDGRGGGGGGGGGGGKGEDDGRWIERLRHFRLVQVTLFKKPLVKVKLGDLMAATNGFDPANVIISTKAGPSYKAVLGDASALAVKRLQNCELSEKEFRMEMIRLGQVRHPNLVPLLGFCVVESEKLLVYKHMPNGTLYSLLHRIGNAANGVVDWITRLRIGIGAARGLAWLHHGNQPPLMHQNISSTVILIDDDLDARITDYGLAKLMSSSDNQQSSFVYGDLGEFGYVAPEYATTMVASLKGDVYGFGVVLLELVTGRKPLEVSTTEEGFKGNVVDWVNQMSASGRIKDVIDSSICGKGHDEKIMQFLKVACACVVSSPKDRWSMYQVYQSLKTLGEEHGFSEQYDEFPLVFDKPESENQV
ncbi:hypothetical protein Sjap_015924 [Stephania japonica]|uniref:Protein kinase domain-containing protein n=1 Tax=Stephania japonica TaxID=461633 RepID=A0AAP0NRB9_9MAGN